MEQMKQFNNMDLSDDQLVEVLGLDGSGDFSAEAVFGTTAVVQMDGDAVLDVSGVDDVPFWADTLDMGDVTSVASGQDYSFFDDNQPDMPSAGLEVAAEPLDEQTDIDGMVEVAGEPIAADVPLPTADEPLPTADESLPTMDDALPLSGGEEVADDATLMADVF